MMRIILISVLWILLSIVAHSQINLEVEGQAKITDMQLENTADSLVVQLDDGTLAIRHSKSLKSDLYLGKDTLDGVIFYIYQDENGEDAALLVSNIEGQDLWQNPNSVTMGNRRWDGEFNTNLMIDSPAKNWLNANFSSEWYIPSIDELILLWHNQFHINKAMFASGNTQIANDNSLYWSSTEFDQNTAWAFSARFGTVSGTVPKTNSYLVRAVRKL